MPGERARERSFDDLYREARTEEGRQRQSERLRRIEAERRGRPPSGGSAIRPPERVNTSPRPPAPLRGDVWIENSPAEIFERDLDFDPGALHRLMLGRSLDSLDPVQAFSTTLAAFQRTEPIEPACALEKGCRGFCETCKRCELHCGCAKAEPEPEQPQVRRIRL